MRKQTKNIDPHYQTVLSRTMNRMLDKGEIPICAVQTSQIDTERSITYSKLYDLLNHQYRVQFLYQDDFTVALLIPVQLVDNEYHIGVSKRNPIDQKMAIRGKSLALTRAFQNSIKYILDHEEQKP